MGGCRCTYRTCRATSDKATHFFHYPVFDKTRCQEWLTNGQRQNFLHLKLSQLKNRVVCQHHFKDSMFMNSKKDRLMRRAVPTEDGPYLKDPNETHIKSEETTPDEENDRPVEVTGAKDMKYFTYREKIATYPVQYKNFLEKSDLTTLNDPKLLQSVGKSRKTTINNEIKNPASPNKRILHNPAGSSSKKTNVEKTKSSNVVILSEENFVTPVPIKKPDNFQKVSPGFVLKPAKSSIGQSGEIQRQSQPIITPQSEIVPPESNDENQNRHPICQMTGIMSIGDQLAPGIYHVTECEPRTIPIEIQPLTTTNTDEQALPIPTKTFEAKPNSPAPKRASPKLRSSRLLAKAKLSPGKLAEIEKKRQFNMKLRDAIEEKMSSPDKTKSPMAGHSNSIKSPKNSPIKATKSVGASTKPVKQKSSSSNTLEEKVDLLNNLLMAKVDQNSREIGEIKNLLIEKVSKSDGKEEANSRSKAVQVEWPLIVQKKCLFQEISQYLSQSTANLLYEELFLNNTTLKPSNPKRRKVSRK